jgi:TonB family protein
MLHSGIAALVLYAAAPGQAAILQAGSISDADYPPSAIIAGQQGAAQVRFLVNTAGGVSECNVTATSGSPALDAASCEIVKQRFRFKPARDAAGTAISEWRSQKISWKLPAAPTGSEGYASARLKAEVKVDVAKDGGIESCEVIKPSGDRRFDASACNVLTRNGKLEPKRNAKGRPLRTVMVVPVWQ